MKVTSVFVLLSLFLVTAETVLAEPQANRRPRFPSRRPTRRTRTTKTTTTTKTTAVVGAKTTLAPAVSTPPTTTSIVVPPAGSVTPPAGGEVSPEVTPVAEPTGGGVLVDPPVGGNNDGNDGGNNGGNGGGNNGGNDGGNNGGNDGGNNGGNNPNLLLPENVQENSSKTGQEGGQTAGQSNSLTDPANFINFCTGKQLTNGIQGRTGGATCNGIPMGQIPSRDKMVSSLITSPTFGTTLGVGEKFDIVVKMRGLSAGIFTNPDLTYYAAPQQLDNGGQILGHTHVTIQLIDSLDNAPDPDKFEFFKGINDDGDGQGTLTASVNNGLPVAGTYRVCTMSSAGNHQPVLMPVAQRGAQDDCVRFTVGQANNGGNNGGDNGGNNGGNKRRSIAWKA